MLSRQHFAQLKNNMKQSVVQDFKGFSELCQQVAQQPPHLLVQAKPLWIFGAGQFGRDVCAVLRNKGFDVQGFIESTPRTDKVLDLPVVSWRQLEPHQLMAQLVIGIFNRAMPLDQLKKISIAAGFADIFMPWDIYTQFEELLGWRFWLSAAKVILDNLAAIEKTYLSLTDEQSRRCLLDICTFRLGQNNSYASFSHPDNQYFNTLTLSPLRGKKVSFVDGGAYNGDTFLELLEKTKVANAYLFEPDLENFKALTKALINSPVPAVCLPLAVSDQYSILSFNAGNGEGGSIAENGAAHIAAVALDEVLSGHHVDFIKLDVEGAEIPALRGARELIKRSRPVLAISLYHRPQDVWEIPEQLTGICSSYSIYIRQHYFNSFDSVLYLIPN